MPEPELRITSRNLPHWILEGSVYFVTFRLAHGSLKDQDRQLVIDHLKQGHRNYYMLSAAVVMPDHVHLLIQPTPNYPLSRIMKGIKGVSARRLNNCWKATGQVWQDESWDRIVRDEKELLEKLHYMANNPVKAGLATSLEEYVGWFQDEEFIPWLIGKLRTQPRVSAQTGMSVPPFGCACGRSGEKTTCGSVVPKAPAKTSASA